MSLEVHIYGSGFGETIFLRWPGETGGWRGALVDAHSPSEGRWLAEKLKALDLAELDLAVATHPHLDHIFNLAAGLERAKIHPRRCCYWPGLSSNFWMQFFGRLAAQRGGDLPQTARMVRQWFSYVAKEIKERNSPGHDIGGQEEPDCFLERTVSGHTLRFTAIGPWLEGMNRLVKNASGSIGRRGRIDCEHRHANDVSIGLLIEYGDAQIVLGGDMEQINWNALQRQVRRPKFQPSLVKVSHHGSANGRISGMWPRGAGFFDGRSDQAIAVVTPWRQASGELPKGNDILHEISDAGFTVYVTGEGSTPRYRITESHVSIRVNPDRTTKLLEHFKVRIIVS